MLAIGKQTHLASWVNSQFQCLGVEGAASTQNTKHLEVGCWDLWIKTLFYRLNWCKNGNKIWHWHLRRAKCLNFLQSDEVGTHLFVNVHGILSAMYEMYQAPFNNRQDLHIVQQPWSLAAAAEPHTQMKIRKPVLLCLPPARILLPATAKSLEKSSWNLLLIYGTIFMQYPLKPHGFKCSSYEFSLKNIRDSYHFMSLLFVTLKGFLCDSRTCSCVK